MFKVLPWGWLFNSCLLLLVVNQGRSIEMRALACADIICAKIYSTNCFSASHVFGNEAPTPHKPSVTDYVSPYFRKPMLDIQELIDVCFLHYTMFESIRSTRKYQWTSLASPFPRNMQILYVSFHRCANVLMSTHYTTINNSETKHWWAGILTRLIFFYVSSNWYLNLLRYGAFLLLLAYNSNFFRD